MYSDIACDKQDLITLGDDTPYSWGQFVWTLTRLGDIYVPTLKKTLSCYWKKSPDGFHFNPFVRLAATGEEKYALDCYATKKAAMVEANKLNGVKI